MTKPFLIACMGIMLVARVSHAQIAFEPKEFVSEMPVDAQGIDVKFVVTNIGKTPRVIKTVKTACPCTRVHLDDRTLMPGESTDVATRLTPNTLTRDYHTVFAFVTDDPVQQTYSYSVGLLTSSAPRLRFRPNLINIDSLKPGEVLRTKIEVFYSPGKRKDLPSLDALQAETNIPGLAVRPQSAGKDYFVYEATFTAPRCRADAEGYVRFSSQAPAISFDLPVHVHVDGVLKVTPSEVYWGFLFATTGFPVTRQVAIEIQEPEPAIQYQLEYDKDLLTVSERTAVSPALRVYDVSLKKPPVSEGKFSCVLTVTTTNGVASCKINSVGYVYR